VTEFRFFLLFLFFSKNSVVPIPTAVKIGDILLLEVLPTATKMLLNCEYAISLNSPLYVLSISTDVCCSFASLILSINLHSTQVDNPVPIPVALMIFPV